MPAVETASAVSTGSAQRGVPDREQTDQTMTEVSNKQNIITGFQTHEKDTGSCDVQIALLTARISHLTDHLRVHRKDFHSRRGLLAMASRRRKLLDYLKRHDLPKYTELLKRLNLRK